LCNTKLIKDDNVKNGDELLELIPKDQKLQFKIIRILVNSDGMISKLEITDYMDIQYIFQFSNIKFNQDISSSKFTYSPPKGIQIIDLR
jgi:outer membrane lipoprotein-sorting protein